MGLWRVLKGEEPNFFEKLAFKLSNWNDKGAYGEFITSYAIDNVNDYHRVIKNLYIPYKNKTSEIDIVLVTTKGFYVIENKNYSGWVFGNEKYKNWYQTFPNGEKYTFYNPIWQNRTHIRALSQFLTADINLFHSYIVFSGENFKGKIQYESDDFVVATHENILQLLNYDISRRHSIFTTTAVDNISMRLYNCSNVSDSIKKQHISNCR